MEVSVITVAQLRAFVTSRLFFIVAEGLVTFIDSAAASVGVSFSRLNYSRPVLVVMDCQSRTKALTLSSFTHLCNHVKELSLSVRDLWEKEVSNLETLPYAFNPLQCRFPLLSQMPCVSSQTDKAHKILKYLIL